MSDFPKRLAMLTPLLALGAGAASASGGTDGHALALQVNELGDSVEIELIANSQVTQQVDYEIELVGSSRSRHAGSTSVAAGNRHVLSRLKTSYADGWCATARVSEANGERYTLTAGDCDQQ